MKNSTNIGKGFLLIFVLAITFTCAHSAEIGSLPLKQVGPPRQQYTQGEVLVGLKEGADMEAVLKDAAIPASGFKRVHDISSAANNFRKDYKIEKDTEGWYWFTGKEYKAVEEIPDEVMFQEAYKNMSDDEKAIYRNYKVNLPEGLSVDQAVGMLQADPRVEYVEPNYIASANYVPNDSYYSYQWAHTQTSAALGWDVTRGASSVIIAILDTGVDYSHPDLAANIWHDVSNNNAPGKDFVDIDFSSYPGWTFYTASGQEDYQAADDDPKDYHGHGTHCAGIAGAIGNNSIGIAGVCHNCKIMPVRVGFLAVDDNGEEQALLESDDVANGIYYAANKGAKIISMSFGFTANSSIVANALNYAYSKGAVLVAASGNSAQNGNPVIYPAALDNVLAVGATNKSGTRSSFSSYGSYVDVVAPGGESIQSSSELILSTFSTQARNYSTYGSYAYGAGTSAACPYVAGLAGLLLSVNPELTNSDIYQQIENSADDLGVVGRDDEYGFGRVNVNRACSLYKGDVKITFPKAAGYVKGSVSIIGSVIGMFQSYTLRVSPKGSTNSTVIASGSNAVVDGILGVWNTASLVDGNYTIELSENLYNGGVTSTYIDVYVDNINDQPVFDSSSDKAVCVGKELVFQVHATDPDDPSSPEGKLYYSADNLPPGASFSSDTRTFSWQPTIEEVGSYHIKFSAFDNKNKIDMEVLVATIYVDERQVTSNSQKQSCPDIYDNIVVYVDDRNGARHIYMTDLSTGVDSPVSEASIFQESVKVFGKTFVWSHYSNSQHQVYMKDMTDGIEKQLSAYGFLPCVYDNKVLWREWDGVNYKINLYNVSLGQLMPSPYTSKVCMWNFAFADDILVLQEPIGSVARIVIRDLSTGKDIILDYSYLPAVSKKRVSYCWNSGINVYDIITGESKRIAEGAGKQAVSDIWEDKVVWQSYKNGNNDIYLYDLTYNLEIPISTGSASQENPAIYKDKIVWQDNRNGNFDIYMAQIFYVPEITAIAPSSVNSGSQITLTGKYFASAHKDSRVEFANGAIAQIVSWSDTEIICTAPENVESGLVKVVTLGGESNGVNVSVGFAYTVGDVSGDGALSAYDAALAARIAVGLDAYPTGDNLTKTDVSGDGFVTAYDAALIAQKAVGLIVKFPVE
jgi:beta propeller repeat protein